MCHIKKKKEGIGNTEVLLSLTVKNALKTQNLKLLLLSKEQII